MSIFPQLPSLPPTWDDLVALEPRLNTLAQWARSQRGQGHRYKLGFWYRALKPDLCLLVGRCRPEGGILASAKAYDVAYDRLLFHELGWDRCRGHCDACRAEEAAA